MLRNEVLEVFDGTMLGDSGLARAGGSAYMYAAKSGTQYMPYLMHLRDVLSLLEVEFSAGYPKSSKQVSRGKPYSLCRLESHVSSFLLEQYRRWYPNGKKAIPNDVMVTPVSIAYEFMDDGSTSWIHGNLVVLRLSTNCYSKEEVYSLSDLIEARFGVHFYPLPQPGWVLHLRKVDEVNLFLDQIEKHILSCYRYKVKRPQYKSVWSIQEEFNSLRRKLEGEKYDQSR